MSARFTKAERRGLDELCRKETLRYEQAVMTECEEIAATLPRVPSSYTFGDCTLQVLKLMPDESVTVISNVAWALYQRDCAFTRR